MKAAPISRKVTHVTPIAVHRSFGLDSSSVARAMLWSVSEVTPSALAMASLTASMRNRRLRTRPRAPPHHLGGPSLWRKIG